MRILIAVDDSDCSNAAVEAAGNGYWPPNVHFLILTVAEPMMTDLGGWVTCRELKNHEELVEEKAQQLRQLVPQLPVDARVGEGNAADQIVRWADEWQADLIMIGSHSRRGIEHFLLGSVAEQVVNRANCSVEVVKTLKATEPLRDTTFLSDFMNSKDQNLKLR